MGACFSTSSSPPPPPTAKVVSLKADLLEFLPPITVSQVLLPNTFLCNSDILSYDEPILALRSDALLSPNQLYFLLPISLLNSTLTAPDMAALAVRASQALQSSSSSADRGSKKKSSIAPLFFLGDEEGGGLGSGGEVTIGGGGLKKKKGEEGGGGGGMQRSGSMRKLQRYASRRAKVAVRSFRLRLGTIYEGTAVL